ncbi:MAG TPA: hypothetical protein VGE74_14165 [Gemmata sp.]
MGMVRQYRHPQAMNHHLSKRHYPLNQKRWAESDAKSMKIHYSEPYSVYLCPVCKRGWLVGSMEDAPARLRKGRA